jgi:hypothetical protein
VIRYNWIEDGAHVLDLVDAQEAKPLTRGLPSFHTTYVYGNVIVRNVGRGGGSMVHYGGDSGEVGDYRKGTLHFYNNTVIVKNDPAAHERTAIFELSTNEEHLASRNNVHFSTARPHDESPVGMLTRGENPGFRAGNGAAGDDYRLPIGGGAVPLAPEVPEALWPRAQYVVHRRGRARAVAAGPSRGALDD